MPTASAVKQFLLTVVVPPLAGVLATWVTVHIHLLATFHINASAAAGAITQVLIFGVVSLIAFLGAHHILTGSYDPATPPQKPL